MKLFFQSYTVKIIALALAVSAIVLVYLTYKTYGNWEFALALREVKYLPLSLSELLRLLRPSVSRQ